MKIKIAVVSSENNVTVCGPNDFNEKDYQNAMEAAICWHLESGEGFPTGCYWAEVDVPEFKGYPVVEGTVEEAPLPEF